MAASTAGWYWPKASASTATMCNRMSGLLPATNFAVDAYVRFVRDKTLLEAVASSLTELFAPESAQDPHRCPARRTIPSPTRRRSPISASGSTRRRAT